MTVEAQRLNPFSPQPLLTSRDMMNDVRVTGNPYAGGVVGYGGAMLLPGIAPADPFFSMNCSSAAIDALPPKAAVKSDSGVTFGLPLGRKRSREEASPLLAAHPAFQNSNNRCGSLSFLGEDISSQLLQQQRDVDRFIVQHMEKVRMEVGERRKRYARNIVSAIEQGIQSRLKAKEAEIENIGKLNWALEERVKSLSVENQIWREMAQTNEARANFLRSNLEQVLAGGVARGGEAAELMDDAQSCCSSNHGGHDVDGDGCGSPAAEVGSAGSEDGRNGQRNSGNCNSIGRLCRKCGNGESCVLLLPCRHLCLCTVCGSSQLFCPICKSTQNASLHVNFSS
ncbi:unnamed protein product [Cuscuta campestris]|uniref:RING-type domain-containing protein n=1 Tax=Cuscuta campestris TaxID=132261 RepID=A0A484MS25_9ASTE|nr:unnamed protein product [Cuscuta campestris]